jgi:hypothetical protein
MNLSRLRTDRHSARRVAPARPLSRALCSTPTGAGCIRLRATRTATPETRGTLRSARTRRRVRRTARSMVPITLAPTVLRLPATRQRSSSSQPTRMARTSAPGCTLWTLRTVSGYSPALQRDIIHNLLFFFKSEGYQPLKLINQEFTLTVDMSQLGCGLNGAVYFSAMPLDGGASTQPNNKAGAKYGTGYCDSQCPQDLKVCWRFCQVRDRPLISCAVHRWHREHRWLDRDLRQFW